MGEFICGLMNDGWKAHGLLREAMVVMERCLKEGKLTGAGKREVSGVLARIGNGRKKFQVR
jgi:hypothetical protein